MRTILDARNGRWVVIGRPDGGEAASRWNAQLAHGHAGDDRHHLIPWSALSGVVELSLYRLLSHRMDVWEAIVMVACPDAATNKLQYRDHARRACATIPSAIPLCTPAYVPGTNPTKHHEWVYEVLYRFCWMPGNLFLGKPGQNRCDDPGDTGFDIPPANGLPHAGKERLTQRVEVLLPFYWFLLQRPAEPKNWTSKEIQDVIKKLGALQELELWNPDNLIWTEHHHWQKHRVCWFLWIFLW